MLLKWLTFRSDVKTAVASSYFRTKRCLSQLGS